MAIPNTTNIPHTQPLASQQVMAQTEIKQPEVTAPVREEYKSDFFDKISEKVVNPKDITDTVKVPRTIFKGYLGFMAGTSLIFMASFIENVRGFKTISKFLKFTGFAATIVGTYEFVKPFLLKPKNEAKDEAKTEVQEVKEEEKKA